MSSSVQNAVLSRIFWIVSPQAPKLLETDSTSRNRFYGKLVLSFASLECAVLEGEVHGQIESGEVSKFSKHTQSVEDAPVRVNIIQPSSSLQRSGSSKSFGAGSNRERHLPRRY